MFSFTPACLFTWGLIYKSDLEYGRKPWIHNFQPAIYTPPKNTRRLASISSTIAAISSSKQFASLIRSVSDWKLICAGTVQRNEKTFYLILNMKFFHRSRVFFFFPPIPVLPVAIGVDCFMQMLLACIQQSQWLFFSFFFYWQKSLFCFVFPVVSDILIQVGQLF